MRSVTLYPVVCRDFDGGMVIVQRMVGSKISNWRIPFIAEVESDVAITTESGIEITTESGETLVTE